MAAGQPMNAQAWTSAATNIALQTVGSMAQRSTASTFIDGAPGMDGDEGNTGAPVDDGPGPNTTDGVDAQGAGALPAEGDEPGVSQVATSALAGTDANADDSNLGLAIAGSQDADPRINTDLTSVEFDGVPASQATQEPSSTEQPPLTSETVDAYFEIMVNAETWTVDPWSTSMHDEPSEELNGGYSNSLEGNETDGDYETDGYAGGAYTNGSYGRGSSNVGTLLLEDPVLVTTEPQLETLADMPQAVNASNDENDGVEGSQDSPATVETNGAGVKSQGGSGDTETGRPTQVGTGGGGGNEPPIRGTPTGGGVPDPDEPEEPGEEGNEPQVVVAAARQSEIRQSATRQSEVLTSETEESEGEKPAEAATPGAAVVDLSKSSKKGMRGLISNALLVRGFRKQATGTAISPTVQAATVVAAIGAAVALKDFAHIPELVDLLGGAGATFLSQMRSWSTRIAYFRVAQAGTKALFLASRGDADGAIETLDRLAKYAAFPYGLDTKGMTTMPSPEDPTREIPVTLFQKRLTQAKQNLTDFANAVAEYNSYVNDPSRTNSTSEEFDQVRDDYEFHVPDEAQVKGKVATVIPHLPAGKLVKLAVGAADNIDFLLDGNPYTSPEQLRDIVAGYAASPTGRGGRSATRGHARWLAAG